LSFPWFRPFSLFLFLVWLPPYALIAAYGGSFLGEGSPRSLFNFLTFDLLYSVDLSMMDIRSGFNFLGYPFEYVLISLRDEIRH